MLKAIALAGFFFTASAFTPPVGASAQPVKAKASVQSPVTQAPHAICPGGRC
jgi:hypothetical protein